MSAAAGKMADAAFFEDWSEWASLDDLPERPVTGSGHAIIYGARAWGRWSRYYCELRHGRGWCDGPHFELGVLDRDPAMRLCGALPGARRHPGLYGLRRVGLQKMRGTWQVPAEHWREVRAALPVIKASIIAWLRV